MVTKQWGHGFIIAVLTVISLAGTPTQTLAAVSGPKHIGLTEKVAKTSPSQRAAAPAAEIGAAAINLPSGYSVTTVQTGYNIPTKAIWTPATPWASAGETFVAEHAGVVKRTNLATGQQRVLIDIQNHVNTYADRGLNSIAIDPDYATNKYLYMLYTYENDASKPSSCKTSTLTRVTVNATGASAETTILGKVHGGGTCTLNANGEPVGSACPTATTADCIPSDFWSHSGGDIGFFADKTMLISHGDGASYNDVDPTRAYRAQNVDSLAGKVLHVTRTGAGLTTNPYAAGKTNTNRSKVWSMGDRNQFRFKVINGQVIGGNVGWFQFEEIQKSAKGGNNGWPCYEGSGRATNGYELSSQCKSMYTANKTVQSPLVSANHNGAGAAIVGGLVVTGNKYPGLTGKYLYGDYAIDNISFAGFDANFTKVTQAPQILATNADGPVDFQQAPDGSIYYVSINTGELRRLDYTPGLSCGADQWKMEYYPNADRSGTPTHQECRSAAGTPKLGIDWALAAPTFTPADPTFPTDYFSLKASCSCSFTGGQYSFTGLADDWARISVDGVELLQIDNPNARTATATLSGAHNVSVEYTEGFGDASINLDWTQPYNKPGLHIAAPLDGQEYTPGTTVAFNADEAVDSQGQPLPPSAVTWTIQKNHCYSPGDCHVHTLQTSTGLSGTFLMDAPDVPPSTSYVTIALSATDPGTGLSQTVTVDIYYK